MADPRGACQRRLDTGLLDGCQDFEPKESDPKVCDWCGCKKGFHLKLITTLVPEVPEPGAQPTAPPLVEVAAASAAPAELVQAAQEHEGLSVADVHIAKKQQVSGSERPGGSLEKGESNGLAVEVEPEAEMKKAPPPATPQRKFETTGGPQASDTHESGGDELPAGSRKGLKRAAVGRKEVLDPFEEPAGMIEGNSGSGAGEQQNTGSNEGPQPAAATRKRSRVLGELRPCSPLDSLPGGASNIPSQAEILQESGPLSNRGRRLKPPSLWWGINIDPDWPYTAKQARPSSEVDKSSCPPKSTSAHRNAARCNRSDGKHWRCKKERPPGRAHCDYHCEKAMERRAGTGRASRSPRQRGRPGLLQKGGRRAPGWMGKSEKQTSPDCEGQSPGFVKASRPGLRRRGENEGEVEPRMGDCQGVWRRGVRDGVSRGTGAICT